MLQCDPEQAIQTTKLKQIGTHNGYARIIFTDFEKLESIHDIVTDAESNLEFMVARYRRRWHRLMDKTRLDTVVFVFGGTLTETQVYKFFNIVSNNQAYLMCVHDGPFQMNISHPNFIEKLRPNYRIPNMSPTWDQKEFDWHKMFEEVQKAIWPKPQKGTQ